MRSVHYSCQVTERSQERSEAGISRTEAAFTAFALSKTQIAIHEAQVFPFFFFFMAMVSIMLLHLRGNIFLSLLFWFFYLQPKSKHVKMYVSPLPTSQKDDFNLDLYHNLYLKKSISYCTIILSITSILNFIDLLEKLNSCPRVGKGGIFPTQNLFYMVICICILVPNTGMLN